MTTADHVEARPRKCLLLDLWPRRCRRRSRWTVWTAGGVGGRDAARSRGRSPLSTPPGRSRSMVGFRSRADASISGGDPVRWNPAARPLDRRRARILGVSCGRSVARSAECLFWGALDLPDKSRSSTCSFLDRKNTGTLPRQHTFPSGTAGRESAPLPSSLTAGYGVAERRLSTSRETANESVVRVLLDRAIENNNRTAGAITAPR